MEYGARVQMPDAQLVAPAPAVVLSRARFGAGS